MKPPREDRGGGKSPVGFGLARHLREAKTRAAVGLLFPAMAS